MILDGRKQLWRKLTEVTVRADWDKDNGCRTSTCKAHSICKPCIFDSIATFYVNFKHDIGVPKKFKFDDGKDIATQYLDTVLQSSIELAYSHKWIEGNAVIIDSHPVSRERPPWKGKRKTLASKRDTSNRHKI